MKNIILLLFVCVSQVVAAQSCYDTCSFHSYFMHNYDTSKYASIDMGQQGLYVLTENMNLNSSAGLQIDSYKGSWKMEATSNNYSSFIAGNEDFGIDIGCTNDIQLVSVKTLRLQALENIILTSGSAMNMTLSNQGNGKLIIKTTSLPTSCSGQSSGTWYISSGFLKVCP